jgi:tRNA modification GTPase
VDELSAPFRHSEVSAYTGLGFGDLEAAIVRFAEEFRNDAGNEIIAINARHALALERAKDSLRSAGDKVDDVQNVELLASDLREVLDALGDIGGKVDNEIVIDRLFATFCIGK